MERWFLLKFIDWRRNLSGRWKLKMNSITQLCGTKNFRPIKTRLSPPEMLSLMTEYGLLSDLRIVENGADKGDTR